MVPRQRPAYAQHVRLRATGGLPLVASGLDQDLDCFAVVHCPVALGYVFQAHRSVEDLSGVELCFQDFGQELFYVRARRCDSACDPDVLHERGSAWDRAVLWHSYATDGSAWPRDADRRQHRLGHPYALEHGVDSVASGQLAHSLGCFLAALGHDVGRSELDADVGALLVTAQQDDLLGAEALRRHHAAEADGPVADDRDRLARRYLGAHGCVVPGGIDVREREQRRHQRVVLGHVDLHERAVGLRHAHRLALTAVGVAAPEAAVATRGVQALVAEVAGAVREDERRDYDVALLQRPHLGADVLDDADELVTHLAALFVLRHVLVRPEVAAADARPCDAQQRVGGLGDRRVGNVLDPDVTRAVHDGGSHWLRQ